MNHIFFPKKEDPPGMDNRQPGFQESIFPEGHDINITEGGEFLDDAIRMHDQPLLISSPGTGDIDSAKSGRQGDAS